MNLFHLKNVKVENRGYLSDKLAFSFFALFFQFHPRLIFNTRFVSFLTFLRKKQNFKKGFFGWKMMSSHPLNRKS